MDLTQVNDVVELEKKAFHDECKETYVALVTKIGMAPKVSESVIFVGSSLPKKYLDASKTALAANKAIFIAGKGQDLARAITVAEQVKAESKGRIVQFNKADLHPSLINPAFKPAVSRKNVSVFFDDDQGESQAPEDVLREIQGHKVYQTASISILLLAGECTETLEGWTKQAEEK